MLNQILNLKGAQLLSKTAQESILGGGVPICCQYFSTGGCCEWGTRGVPCPITVLCP